MDLPDVELVVQYRATCGICTLWQRFGRAARDRTRTAKVLFLVEPKHYDEVKTQKATRQAERKRKADQAQLGDPGRAFKKVCGATGPVATGAPGEDAPIGAPGTEPIAQGLGDDEEMVEAPDAVTPSAPSTVTPSPGHTADVHAERRRLYNQPPSKVPQRGRKSRDELEPAMDDMINAKSRGLGCSRAPLTIHFGNDKLPSKYIESI